MLTNVRSLTVLIAAVALCVAPPAMGAQSRTHTVTVTTPAKLDFTIATVTLRGSGTGLRLSIIRPTNQEYVAAAAVRANLPRPASPPPPLRAFSAVHAAPEQILILVVNRQPSGSTTSGPKWVNVRIQTRAAGPAPEFSQYVDVLADGAPGQDCSALTNYPGLGHAYLWGYQLQPLAGSSGPFGVSETVAHAFDQACSDSIDTQFERWVCQEPPTPHP
jgi:hypothetical protein